MKHTLEGLPLGSGAVIGNFVRSIYLTASSRYAIIGIGVNDLDLLSRIGNTSVLVSDIIIGLVGEEYAIPDSAVTGQHRLGDSDIYSVSFSFEQIQQLSTSHFASILTTPERTIATFNSPVSFTVTLYVANIQGTVSDSVSSVKLREAGVSNKFIALPAHGHRLSKCWSTLEQNQFTEDVTIHFEGPSAEIEAADLAHLQQLMQQYIALVMEICTDI